MYVWLLRIMLVANAVLVLVMIIYIEELTSRFGIFLTGIAMAGFSLSAVSGSQYLLNLKRKD